MYGIGVVIGVFISNPDYSNYVNILLGFITALALQASAFALNDYLDYEVDVANERFDRPLVRGDLSKRAAILLCALTFPVGIIAAYLISVPALIFAFLITLAGYAYDLKLKEFGIVGNLYIAFSMAAPFLFGGIIATGTIVASTALLSAIAFLSGFGREIMKGIEDIEGDALRDVKTVARTAGAKIAAKLAAAFYVVAVAISPLPVLLLKNYWMDPKYIIPVAVTDVTLLYVSAKLIKDHSKEAIKKYRKQTLIAMMFGLIGFLAGAF